jgi:hypothetical protein
MREQISCSHPFRMLGAFVGFPGVAAQPLVECDFVTHPEGIREQISCSHPFRMLGAFVGFPGVAAQPLATISHPEGVSNPRIIFLKAIVSSI